MSSAFGESDSEDDLPGGWEERATTDGRVYYANHSTKSTQWTHPRTGKKKRVSGELPYGWEKKITSEGRVLYIDHINKKTTYTDPRLAFAIEEKEAHDDIRQRFDASSTALQILLGRDLSGKVIIVTGANCGIGLETSKSLSFHGAHVIMACRNLEKAKEAISSIHNERPQAKVEAMHLDLASFKSVHNFVNEFKAKFSNLSILILNAAVFALPYSITEDGYETIFQVCHLSHFLLTNLLQDLLISSAPARVVVLSSESHRFANLNEQNISPEKLSPTDPSQFISMFAYNNVKLCNLLFSNELNRRLSPKGIYSNGVHPGNMVSTSLARNWWPYRLLYAFVRPFTKSLQQAAATGVYCAVAPELEGTGGLYFNNCCQCQPSKSAEDVILARKLWEISEQMIAGNKHFSL